MKLVMTLLVRDEQDILRENLAFHLAHGVDEFILMDNLSVDGTAEIAREFERAGRLHYVLQQQDDFSQAHWVTEMARRAARDLGADWVINSDADEFWWPHTGSLKDALRSIPPDALATSAQRVNFVARVPNGQPFWRRMNVRQTASTNALGQPLPGKVAHLGLRSIAVDFGNHGVSLGGVPLPCVPAPATIFHFPVRSRAQFFNKIVNGARAIERNAELPPSTGETWRALYGLHLDGRFDEAYEKLLFTDDEIAHGLTNGSLVRDERMISAMEPQMARLLA